MSLLDTEQAAAWVRMVLHKPCTPRTIRRWVAAGTLTNHGTARHIRIRHADLRRIVT